MTEHKEDVKRLNAKIKVENLQIPTTEERKADAGLAARKGIKASL